MQGVRFSFETIREALDHRAGATPAALSYCFLRNSEIDGEAALPALNGETIALLQYTSGSAGDLKGVIVTHRNLCGDQVLLQEALATGPQSSTVSWPPLVHDMGLIIGMAQ
jgi:acyl-CoA synthetase (AMP-forming)/AMP-acid ligase II